MTLLVQGYYPSTYFPEDYFDPHYWAYYGTEPPLETGLFLNFGNCEVSDAEKLTTVGNPAYARTENFYEGEIAFQFKASVLDTNLDEFYIGVNTDTDPTSAFLEECFQFYVSGVDGSKLVKYYNAGPGSAEYEYTADTVFRIIYSGSIISYYIDDVLIDTATVNADQNFYTHFRTGDYGSYIGDCITDFEILTLAYFYEDVSFDSLITKGVSFDSHVTITKAFDSLITTEINFDSPLED